MSNHPDVELALDLRSYERITVLASLNSDAVYPSDWLRPRSLAEISLTFQDFASTIIIVDRTDINRRTVSLIGEHRPRVLAFVPQGVEQEKSMRRMLTAAYPWSDGHVWTIHTSFGKMLVTNDVRGPAYDRDSVIDIRPPLGTA